MDSKGPLKPPFIQSHDIFPMGISHLRSAQTKEKDYNPGTL
nr:hypothetical protein Q903MT_gene5398 [Picea sitchensis]